MLGARRAVRSPVPIAVPFALHTYPDGGCASILPVLPLVKVLIFLFRGRTLQVAMPFPHTREEKALRKAGHITIAGCDEVGKGAWAGPLVAAAVVLPERFSVQGIQDSKKLTPGAREKLFVRITKHALSWAVGVVSHDTIDRIGIQKANTKAIEESLKKLHIEPDAVLVDAIRVKFGKKPVKAIIKGDVKVLSIAAASIVAKVVRDTLMKGLDREHPGYGFWKHVGYGTAEHRAKLMRLGLSKIHRRSFVPMKNMKKNV